MALPCPCNWHDNYAALSSTSARNLQYFATICYRFDMYKSKAGGEAVAAVKKLKCRTELQI
jgi:hypothetical protein